MSGGGLEVVASDAALPLDALPFEAPFRDGTPGDRDTRNVRRQVFGACWSDVRPTPVASPALLAASEAVAASLGIAPVLLGTEDFTTCMAGNRVAAGMRPIATCYGGHQFGHWAGQLGDGRAIVLGSLRGPDGVSRELQLKGAGPTPYSRTADGRAVLRSSLREYVCSEAMAALGVPTTRALSLVTRGARVVRDMFYDGRARPEPGAVVCRVAPSFVRFGHFELPAALEDLATLRALAAWVVRAHFPELPRASEPDAETFAAWFLEVCLRTADLMVHWTRVGFVHGVMNTDNLSILGLTVDYGPYGWLDAYEPGWTPNTTDASTRRYRFEQQPSVALWNLAQLGNAIYPLVGDAAPLEAALGAYRQRFLAGHDAMMAAKLGLSARPEDRALVQDLLTLMQAVETDHTLTFRALMRPVAALAADPLRALGEAFYDAEAASRVGADWTGWIARYRDRIVDEPGCDDATRRARMGDVNPVVIPRNWLAQQAIDAAERGDLGPLQALLTAVAAPYDDAAEGTLHAGRRPEWARNRPGCSALSCSS